MPETPKNPLLISRKTTPNAQPGYQTDARTVENWASSLNAAQVKSAANKNSTTPQDFNGPVGSGFTGTSGHYVGSFSGPITGGPYTPGDFAITIIGGRIEIAVNKVGGSPGVWVYSSLTPTGVQFYTANHGSSTVTPVGYNNVALPSITTANTSTSVSPSIAVTPNGTKAYFAAGGRVTVITVQNGTVIGHHTITDARAVAISPNGATCLVVSTFHNTVTPITIATTTVGTTITVGEEPSWVTFSSDSTKAYVGCIGTTFSHAGTYVVKLATSTATRLTTGGATWQLATVGTLVYAVSRNAGRLYRISTSTTTVTGTVPTLTTNPDRLAVNPSGTAAVVMATGHFYFVDLSTMAITKTVNLTGGVVVIPASGTEAFVSFGGSHSVGIYTLTSFTSQGSVATGTTPIDLIVTQASRTVFAVCKGSNDVTPITVANKSPGASITVGPTPQWAALVP